MKWYSTWHLQGDCRAHEELRGRALGVSIFPCWEIWGGASLEGSGWWRRSWNSPRWLSLLYSELPPKGLWILGFHGGTSLEPGRVFLTYSMSRELRFLPCLNPPFPLLLLQLQADSGSAKQDLAISSLPTAISPQYGLQVLSGLTFLIWLGKQSQTVLCDMKVLWISKLLIIFPLFYEDESIRLGC